MPSRFRKGRLISIQKFNGKQKINEYFVKEIRRLVNWWFDVTNKIVFIVVLREGRSNGSHVTYTSFVSFDSFDEENYSSKFSTSFTIVCF